VAIPRTFTVDYRVRFDEAGADGHLRASGYLRYAQDCAWQHSEAAGFDRTWYAGRQLHWLVRCAQLQLDAPVPYGAVVAVTTRVSGWRRVWARRLTTFQVDGQAVATAITDWVLLDARERPASVPAGIAEHFTDGAPAFQPARVDLPPEPPDAASLTRRVAYSDIDPMAHLNNAAYLDFLDEALAERAGADGGSPSPTAQPRGVRLEYLRPAGPGALLTGTIWPIGGAWAYRLRDADGVELLRALAWSGSTDAPGRPNSRS
jgi:acyl-CoA thioesterase FadM